MFPTIILPLAAQAGRSCGDGLGGGLGGGEEAEEVGSEDFVEVGGGVAAAGDLLFEPIRAELRRRVHMTSLDDVTLAELAASALECGMDVLVEVHSLAEMERAMKLKSRLIGVNNRDLRDFTVDFARTYELVSKAPKDCTFVAESGLTTRADLDAMAEHGIRCFLIGEALMRQSDVEAATRALVG